MEIVIICVVIAVILGMFISQIGNQTNAESNSKTQIDKYGIASSIIKEANVNLRKTSYSPPQGVLTLTKTDLYFFGTNYDIHFPIKSIRSTSCEQSYFIIVNESNEKLYFEWESVLNRNVGVGVLGGNIGTGSSISRNDNPTPREWLQLIDDIRFGKITF